jgi:hypothetical protein
MQFIRMALAAALLAPAVSGAQATAPGSDWPLAAGARVRVLSSALGWRAKTGSVVSATSDTLVFLPSKQSVPTALSTPKIVSIEVAQGTRTHKLQGALLGLFVGGVAGAIMASMSYKPARCQTGSDCFDVLGQGGEAAAGGILGGLTGLLVGSMIGNRQTDNWVPVAVPAR